MWSWLTSLITGPLINAAIGAYKAKLEAGNTTDRIAAELAARELQVQQKEVEVTTQLRIAQIGHWYEPEKLMGYAVAVYVAKLLIWDKVLGFGSTDPLVGWIEVTANLIVVSYFSKRGIENVARIIRR